MLAIDEKSCSQCGKELAHDRKKSAKTKRQSSKMPKVECPYCGELISKRFKKCPACRSDLRTSQKASVQSEIKETSEVSAGPAAEMVKLSETGPDQTPGLSSQTVIEPEPESQTCTIAPEDGMKTPEMTSPVDASPVAEPSEKTDDQVRIAGPVVLVQSMPAEAPPAVASVDLTPAVELPQTAAEVRPAAEAVACDSLSLEGSPQSFDGGLTAAAIVPVSGAIVPISSQPSLAFDAGPAVISPVEQAPATEPPKPEERPLAAPILENAKKPTRLLRKRKLKSAKSPTLQTANSPNDLTLRCPK